MFACVPATVPGSVETVQHSGHCGASGGHLESPYIRAVNEPSRSFQCPEKIPSRAFSLFKYLLAH